MPYPLQRALAALVAIVLVTLGAITVSPDALGVSPRAVAWIGVLVMTLAAGQSFLPRVQGRDNYPKALMERGWALPSEYRLLIARTLAERAAEEEKALTTRPPEWPPGAVV